MRKKLYLSGILVMGVLFLGLRQDAYGNARDVKDAPNEQAEGFLTEKTEGVKTPVSIEDFIVQKTSYPNVSESSDKYPEGFLEISYVGDGRESLPEGEFSVEKYSYDAVSDTLEKLQ